MITQISFPLQTRPSGQDGSPVVVVRPGPDRGSAARGSGRDGGGRRSVPGFFRVFGLLCGGKAAFGRSGDSSQSQSGHGDAGRTPGHGRRAGVSFRADRRPASFGPAGGTGASAHPFEHGPGGVEPRQVTLGSDDRGPPSSGGRGIFDPRLEHGGYL